MDLMSIRNLEAASKNLENHAEVSLIEKKIKWKKKKKPKYPKNSDWGQTQLGETPDLPVAENCNEGSAMEKKKKIKREGKRRNFPVSDHLDQKVLDEPTQELLVIEKPEGALQTSKNHKEVNAERRKKEWHDFPESNYIDQTTLEEDIQELLIKVKPEKSLQTTENYREVSAEKKKTERKKKRHISPENTDLNRKALDEAVQEFLVKVKREKALQKEISCKEVNAEQKRICRKKEKRPKDLKSSDPDQNRRGTEAGSLELPLPVETNLKAAFQTSENHEEAMKKKKITRAMKKLNALDQRDNKLENIREETFSTSFQVVQQSSMGEVSVNCSENILASKKSKTIIKTKIGTAIQGDEVRTHIPTFKLSEELVHEDGNELAKARKVVGEARVSMKENLVETPTGCGNKKRSPTLETRGSIEHVSATSLGLTNAQDMPSKLCEEGCSNSALAEENVSVGEYSGSCLRTPASSRGVLIKGEKSTVCKVEASDDTTTRNPSPKQLTQKNEKNLMELAREVDKFHIFSEENLQLSLRNYEKDEILCSSSIGDAIKVDVHGDNEEYKPFQRVLTFPETPHIIRNRRKLLILDLNGLLADIVSVVPHGYKADKRIGKRPVFKRPFCEDFLKFCFERFNVGVWSSRIQKNVNGMIDFLMGSMRQKLLFCWDLSHCTQTGFKTIENRHKPLVLKELRKLWDKNVHSLPWEKGEYNESNTVLLDDSPYKALRNPPHTAVFPYSYNFQDKNDNSLGPGGDIRVYLEELAVAEDVQKYVELHQFGQHAISDTSPSWGFYSSVIDSLI